MAFFYQNGSLHVGDDDHSLNLEVITSRAERPTYVYDLDGIRQRGEALKASFRGAQLAVHYAMKANNHPAVLRLMLGMGFGADTVSAGEIRLALAAGIPTNRIIFSGVGKTSAEIEFAIVNQIKQINIESPQELERVIAIARRLKRQVDVAFRMNPDVNPDTHPYITTGFRENKFGMDESFLPELKTLLRAANETVRLRGLTMHIGSQLLELGSLRDALEKTLKVHDDFNRDGFTLDRIDIGGGLGINYQTDDEASEFAMIKEYGAMVENSLGTRKLEVMLEPGRILVGRAGLLLSEIQYIKRAPAKTFAIVNTGMHHLLRPALYGAKHRVLRVKSMLNLDDTEPMISLGSNSTQTKQVDQPASPASSAAAPSLMALPSNESTNEEIYDIVGPICESSDCLAHDVRMEKLYQGDWIALADCGAYGFTMASVYNVHDLPAQIAISRGEVLK